jgi:hypothetical protein
MYFISVILSFHLRHHASEKKRRGGSPRRFQAKLNDSGGLHLLINRATEEIGKGHPLLPFMLYPFSHCRSL